MRKLVFVASVIASALLFSGGSSSTASAWCYRGHGYGYASPAWGYPSSYNSPYYVSWRWREWGWPCCGYRSWGSGRGSRHWGLRR
jgi:hypothetical protein